MVSLLFWGKSPARAYFRSFARVAPHPRGCTAAVPPAPTPTLLQDDLDDSELKLSGQPLERDDLDALGWILRRNWGILRLDLSRCAIDDRELGKVLAALRLNTVLRRLDLRQTRITDEGARLAMEVHAMKARARAGVGGVGGVLETRVREALNTR